ncbi:MAG TPA: helix-turn-helix domain-containing protein [Bacillota bacterium]|nr:helix-turn-helix domain-containing protein [Bacillota bacterium]
MEQTLKITNVLSDPTRFHIYEYLVEHHKEVSVNEIAKQFDIHPNVARLHLSKLEDVRMVTSYSKKTGKGGRPSRVYRLSDRVVELDFPHRDYKLLSSIMIESMAELGETGKTIIYETGKKYGMDVMKDEKIRAENMSTEEKIKLLEDASFLLGMYSNFNYDNENNRVYFEVNNCPFKELASTNQEMVCSMHNAFIQGMFESLFDDVELITKHNMFEAGCENCAYVANLKLVK